VLFHGIQHLTAFDRNEVRVTLPTIVACETAVPPLRLSQEETFRLLGYSSPRIRQIFFSSGVEYRHFWADAATFTPTETPDQLQARYQEGAMHLACLAARRALSSADLAPREIDCILVASCTGYLCPDLATCLVGHLGLRDDVQRGALIGHGCAGALPLLQRAADHARAWPGHRVLAIAVEICSAAYFIDGSLETVIGNAICADGAAAVILSASPGESRPAAGPRIVGFQSVLDPARLDKVGFAHSQGKLRIVLAAEIRDLAGPAIEECLNRLLRAHERVREDVRFWVLHPGGRKVIDRAAGYLGLGEEDLRFSQHVLSNYGNMSSPTSLFVLSEVNRAGGPQPGDFGVLIALGPGFAAEGALLAW
jgi:predicted naringenin-chalcone synthase